MPDDIRTPTAGASVSTMEEFCPTTTEIKGEPHDHSQSCARSETPVLPSGTSGPRSLRRHPETIALHGGSFGWDRFGAVDVPLPDDACQLPATDGADKLFALEAAGHC